MSRAQITADYALAIAKPRFEKATNIYVADYVSIGQGSDDRAAIQSVIDAAPSGANLILPPARASAAIKIGADGSGRGLVLPIDGREISITGPGRGAPCLQAIAAMDAVITCSPSGTGAVQGHNISNLDIDCNRLAERATWQRCGSRWTYDRLRGLDATICAFDFSEPGIGFANAYANVLTNMYADGGVGRVMGSRTTIGFRFNEGSSDNNLNVFLAAYCDTNGVYTSGPGLNYLSMGQVFGGDLGATSECFRLGSRATLVNCTADTPGTVGFGIYGDYVELNNTRAYGEVASPGYQASAVGIKLYGAYVLDIGIHTTENLDTDINPNGSVTRLANVRRTDLRNNNVATPISRPTMFGATASVEGGTGVDAAFQVVSPAGRRSGLELTRTFDQKRWRISANTATESGGSAGSSLDIDAFDDAGVFLSTVLSIDRASGQIRLNSSQAVATRVVTAAGAVTVSNSDLCIVVNKTTGAATTVNLPASPTTGRALRIKDGKGDAATNNITITPAAGTIDGAASLVISTNYGAFDLVYNGTQWNVL